MKVVENKILVTESDLGEFYKKIIAGNENELSAEDLEKVKKRFFEVVKCGM